MPPTTRQALLNYLEFLKASGYLYLEPSGDELLRTASAPAQAGSDQPTQTAAEKKLPIVRPSASSAPDSDSAPAAPLAQLIAQAEACRACELGAGRNNLVFSDGDPAARIMFVGEAPGADEDAQGLPFVGRSGQLLTKMILAIGFKREEVYICNTVKCRPPANRDPLPAEKDACEHFLVGQIEIVRPQIIVALGSHAAQYLCRSELTIGQLRGRWHTYHGVPLRATYHPAFLLRSPNQKTRAWEDFQAIHQKYCELNPADARPIWKKE